MHGAKGQTLFPALLKYWRGRSGLSQLDLALAADVSARHVSFLETGRANPSREMVLRLAAALSVPLRDQNGMLTAAGHEAAYAETSLDALGGPIERAIDRMLQQQEPFPMVVMNLHYDVLRMNDAAMRMIAYFGVVPQAAAGGFNAVEAVFDPALLRPYVVDWEDVARALMSRMQREALHRPHDEGLRALVGKLLAYPNVPAAFQQPDLASPSDPVLQLRLQRGDRTLGFLTAVTAFNAPHNVTLEELKIESYFPLDAATEALCQSLAEQPG